MTPAKLATEAATKFNANSPGHFPGRPLFEGLVANAVEKAVAAEREKTRRLRSALQEIADATVDAATMNLMAERALKANPPAVATGVS